ncbi:MAG TPA: ATP-binding cassette domain-containing protein, partial [Solirubrobacteraceae bacterium]|nr:ATP-binding cassette domain-containing protein [Solirubrobacteraceae bacterium]
MKRAAVPGAVIDFDRVSKRYPSGDTGLDDVSFSIMPGEFVFLVGASGSGKSTTMRLLIKETEATGGTIHVAGRELSKIPRRRIPYYRRNVGMVFQDYKLLP